MITIELDTRFHVNKKVKRSKPLYFQVLKLLRIHHRTQQLKTDLNASKRILHISPISLVINAGFLVYINELLITINTVPNQGTNLKWT